MLLILALPLQVADTVVMFQGRGALETTTMVANLVMLTMTFATLVILVLELRDVQITLKRFSGYFQRRVDPILEGVLGVTADVEFVSTVVRTDVQRVSESIHALSDRLNDASDRMEERIQEFNALMEVVQAEAEDVFIGSAAAVRGVRAGARVFGGGRQSEDTMPEGVKETGGDEADEPDHPAGGD